MMDYQTALAIWSEDKDIEKDFYYAPHITRERKTPDETYIVYYWDWMPMPFDKKILEDKRHALITFSEDNYCEYDAVDEDSRGCDEEFDHMFDWRLCIWFMGDELNEL